MLQREDTNTKVHIVNNVHNQHACVQFLFYFLYQVFINLRVSCGHKLQIVGNFYTSHLQSIKNQNQGYVKRLWSLILEDKGKKSAAQWSLTTSCRLHALEW